MFSGYSGEILGNSFMIKLMIIGTCYQFLKKCLRSLKKLLKNSISSRIIHGEAIGRIGAGQPGVH